MVDYATGYIFKMETKKISLILLATLLLIGIASAEASFVFKTNEPFYLEIPMYNNDLSPCSDCACNVSLFFPNGSSVIKNVLGEISDSYCRYNYSLSELGIYGVETYFTDGVDHGRTSFTIEINTTGKQNGNLILPIFLSLAGIVLFGFGLYSKNEYIGLFSGMVFILTGIYVMIYGLGSYLDTYTRGVAYVTLGIGLIICFISVIEMFSEEEAE